MRRRLFLQIYVAFIAVTLLCVAVAAATAHLLRDDVGVVPPRLRAAATLLADTLPAGTAPGGAVQAALDERAELLDARLTLRRADGTLIAASGDPLPAPDPEENSDGGWFRRPGLKGLHVRLDDGRWLSGGVKAWPFGPSIERHLMVLAVLAMVIAIACYPIARRITRRLEALKGGVEQWGGGDLSARVAVQGCDEVATLAESFNRAAEQLEALLLAQRRMLASASHELRSPLARLRMALELVAGPGDEAARRRHLDSAASDIAELDTLVEDLLLTSRLEAQGLPAQLDEVDLLGLLAEEGARVGADVTGEPATVRGSRQALRRMLRNLLENAKRHGQDSPIESHLQATPDRVIITVADRGPGVLEAHREQIFAPFFRPPGHRETQHGGVGLGLSLVREIAQHHGGSASCRPRDGGGSIFEVRVAKAPPQAEAERS